jgi:hypothetical protein
MSERNSLVELEQATLDGENYSRVWSKSKSVSLLVPDEWAVGSTDKFDSVFIGPKTRGMHVNVGITSTTVTRSNRLTLELICKQIGEFLKNKFERVETLETREFEVESRPARLEFFGWHEPKSGMEVAQLMVLVGDDTTLYNITATMLKETVATYRPVIENMVNSIRFARPATEQAMTGAGIVAR